MIKTDIKFDAQLDIVKTYEEGDKQYVEGYAATIDYDDQGDIITQEALKQSENDLIERSTVLFNHDKERPIGKVEEAKGDSKGLKIKVLISKAEPEIWQKIKEGVINKFSIRGAVLESTKEKVKQAGKDIWANIIRAMKLIEVSMVSLPANAKAETLSWYMAKALDENDITNNEDKSKQIENLLKKIEELNVTIKELKGYAVVNGVIQPRSMMRLYGTHIKGLKDRKINESVKCTTKGAVKSLEFDDEIGESCLVEIENGEISEVTSKMADIKKKDGTLYTQEEVDSILAKSEVAEKELVDLKASLEIKEVETKKSIDESIAKISDASKELETVKKDLEAVSKERDELKAKQADDEINKKVDLKWAELETKSYKKEDAVVIKSILKKGFLGQALTPEDTDSLISKKIQGSILKIGVETIGSQEMTKERKDALIAAGGLRIKPEKK